MDPITGYCYGCGRSTEEKIKWKDGKEYPLYRLEISDKSHPFFTGKQNLVDTAGRIEKYRLKNID